MAELFVALPVYRVSLRRERLFRDRSNPLEIFDDYHLILRYRFPRCYILELIEMCNNELERRTNRNKSLPVYCQVLCALR